MTASTLATLRRRHDGAPESLVAALRRAATEAPLRATRRELLAAADAVLPGPHGVGVVLFPAVSADGHTGCLYRVIASDGPRGDLASVPSDLVARVLAVLGARLPDLPLHGLRLHLSGPLPGEAWSGSSCELAVLLAAVSWALRIPPPPATAVTGRLGTEGTVRAVGHLREKAERVAADLPGGRLIAPGDAALEVALDAALPGWRSALERRAALGWSARVREAQGALFTGSHDRARALADEVLDRAPGDAATRARAAWIAGAARLHLGEGAAGLALLQQARAALPAWEAHVSDPPEDLAVEELEAWVLVALVDAGQAATALARGQTTLGALDRVARRTRRWRWVALQVAGSTHRAAVSTGDLTRAATLLQTWSLDRAMLVDQRARALGDLAEVRRREGRPADARGLIEEARAALPDAAARELTARFLDLFEARLDAEAGIPPAPADPEGAVWPELGFHLLATRTTPADLPGLLAHPAVAHSAALRGVVASELAWHLLHGGQDAPLHVALAGVLDDGDDPGRNALHARLRTAPTAADLAALRARAPYG
ncbi:MAG: hypothetical protein H6732_10555 [Alphaproteobacteria bacterium]|nr:hypothetical protein [Alphaproteobacteria bacterium]